MTAIYAVWNQIGLALAADSNGTSRRDNQAWVDPVTKTYKLRDHQIAIALSGSVSVDQVEILELIRVWEKTLPSSHLSTTKEYIADFMAWFANANLPDRSVRTKDFEGYFEQINEYVKNDCYEDFQSENLDGLADKLFDNYNYTNSRLNLFGAYWDVFSRDIDGADKVEYQSDFAIRDIREILNRKLGSALDDETHSRFSYRHSPYYETVVQFEFEKVFKESFNVSFNPENQSHVLVREFSIDLVESLSLDTGSSLIIVGYGADDWVPSGATIDIGDTILGVPNARITSFGDSESLHYLTIGISHAVPQLALGVSSEARQAFSNIASTLLNADDFKTMETALDGSTEETRDRLFGKLDQLTIERLEFVSRLFVEIESLHSYLSEPVPGVGGDIRVITLTKTTSKEKHYSEIG